jgi:hypothetical protein
MGEEIWGARTKPGARLDLRGLSSGWLFVTEMSRHHPERRDQDSLRLLLHTARPPQPWRIAHSRTLLCSPTTYQTREPAGLDWVRPTLAVQTFEHRSTRPVRDPIADIAALAAKGSP